MKFPERWHKWPEETPPENEPLQVEVWNSTVFPTAVSCSAFRSHSLRFTASAYTKLISRSVGSRRCRPRL